MIVKISKAFEKDISRFRDQHLKQAIFDVIKLIQQVPDLRGIPQLKKLKGHKEFYRIRLGSISSRHRDNKRNSRVFSH